MESDDHARAVLRRQTPSGHEAGHQGQAVMTRAEWEAVAALKAQRVLDRRQLEAEFNAEIVRRARAGETKEEIVASMRITRELFNRAIRTR